MFVEVTQTKNNNMKKILALLAIVCITGTAFAQENKTAWPELKAFHAIMSASFHSAEEGNFAPLKEKTAEMYRAAKLWYASEIPENYKKEETKKTLEALMIQCNDIWDAVEKKASDSKLKDMITAAHDTFHKIVGECKKH
ncbi:MAG: hypothetical protein RIR96_935 [Bacteroidota bacterium]